MLYPRILNIGLFLLLPVSSAMGLAPEDFRVTYGANNSGKHIVFVAGEREYRSEESLPALARILAKHHGFKCTVLFTLADDGTIQPQGPNLQGLDILQNADLLFMFMRFLDLADEEMAHFDAYVQSGKPIVALRTSTHAFRIADGSWKKYDWEYDGNDYLKGFGRQVLGETWVAHNGDNHLQSTRLTPVKHQQSHPVLRGVGEMHMQTGSYLVSPRQGSWPLVLAQPLQGMEATSDPHPALLEVPAVWTRIRDVGKKGRVLTCTHGASEDILDEGLRRLLVNACFWAVREEDRITPHLDIDFVGPFKPTEYASWAWIPGLRPSDLEGYSSTIGGGSSAEPPKRFLERLEMRRAYWRDMERTEP